MTERVDLFDSTYQNFTDQVLRSIRNETFGKDIGQNSWTTVEEYDRFISLLHLREGCHLLEIASGSGGPAIYTAQSIGCRVTGIDANESGVETATKTASGSGVAETVQFNVADANGKIPFDENAFGALI